MEQIISAKAAAETPLPYVLVDEQRLDLTRRDTGRLQLSFAPSVWDSDLFLVIDLYSAANPVHPAGHVGWWKWPLESKGDVCVEVARRADGFHVSFDGQEPREFWENPDYLGLEEPVIAVHVVLRPVISEAVKFDDVLHLYNDPAALEISDRLRRQRDEPSAAAPSAPWYVWPRSSMVHLVATNIFEADAVGNFTLATHQLLRSNGIACQLYAEKFDPMLRGTICHTSELLSAASEDDVVLVSYSIFDPWLAHIAELPSRKVLYFHNITPPRFAQVYDAEFAEHCRQGIAQLNLLRRFDAVLANSKTSAQVLIDHDGAARMGKARRPPADVDGPFAEASRLLQKAIEAYESQHHQPLPVTACPPLIGARDWDALTAEPVDLPPQKTLLLYVGRVAPHKRIEDLFAVFERYHKLNPDSALLVVGGARFDGYSGFLRYLLNTEFASLQPHIHFYSGVSDGQLKTLYQRSSALVMMSEHEGFCVPVVEAMAFDKPVFAHADKAVAETLGQTGRLFHSKDFTAIAANIDFVLSTPWLLRQIVACQRQRLGQLAELASGKALWSVFEKVLFRARAV